MIIDSISESSFSGIIINEFFFTGRVILMEKSDLEAERVALFESVMKNQRSMKELESNLLCRLTSTQVNSIFIDQTMCISIFMNIRGAYNYIFQLFSHSGIPG